IVLMSLSCQKKPAEMKVEIPPEEPLQRLAWDAVQQIKSRIPNASVNVGTISNQAALPESSQHYFRGALENELWQKNIHGAPSVTVNGILTYADKQLQFLWETTDPSAEKVSGMTAVLWSAPQTQPETVPEAHHDHMTHKEVSIPTPVAYLNSVPLDINQNCTNNKEACDILVLYEDGIEQIDWKSGNKKKILIANDQFRSVRSRAPSGKILAQEDGILILNNNLNHPLKFDSSFDQPVAVEEASNFPHPAPGLNTFLLMNGRFFDFELLKPKGMAVIEDNQTLSIGAGTLITANELVGSSLAVIWPSIYTSSTSLPDQPDSVLKFQYDNSGLPLVSKHQIDGEILDLAATDLDRNGTSELLVTIRTKNQIYIDVLDAF
ncbi:MAG TPA: hypothetical protein VLH08_16250, partial [Acidobacteriota bacterium]|nr:hypothetical protein [Acidobacteriota bacterium]